MIMGIGSDIVDVRRIKKSIDRFSERFITRIFTDAERKVASDLVNPEHYYAKRFAAKEAVFKALSVSGIKGLGWQQVETLNSKNGAPLVYLNGHCKQALVTMTPTGYKPQVLISLSDEMHYALAFVIVDAKPFKMDD